LQDDGSRQSRGAEVTLRLAGSAMLVITLIAQPAPAQIPEQEEADSRGDVSTETNPELGQQKQQKVLQSEAARPGDAGKREQETGREPQNANNPTADRPERSHRIERPPRPERHHR
jgi:hypothetical protein